MFQGKVSKVPSTVHVFDKGAGETGPFRILHEDDDTVEHLPIRKTGECLPLLGRDWEGREVV